MPQIATLKSQILPPVSWVVREKKAMACEVAGMRTDAPLYPWHAESGHIGDPPARKVRAPLPPHMSPACSVWACRRSPGKQGPGTASVMYLAHKVIGHIGDPPASQVRAPPSPCIPTFRAAHPPRPHPPYLSHQLHPSIPPLPPDTTTKHTVRSAHIWNITWPEQTQGENSHLFESDR